MVGKQITLAVTAIHRMINTYSKLHQFAKFSWNHAPKLTQRGHGYNLSLLFFFNFKLIFKIHSKTHQIDR